MKINTLQPKLKQFSMLLVAVFVLGGCKAGNDGAGSKRDRSDDPSRCEVMDLGEASDIIPSGKKIPDNQFVALQGITNPKSLVWQDKKSKKIYYVAKIMGTGERLLYMEELSPGQEPRILSEFKGTVHLWSAMPAVDAGPMAAALSKEWGIKIDPEKTFLLKGGTKPVGCP